MPEHDESRTPAPETRAVSSGPASGPSAPGPSGAAPRDDYRPVGPGSPRFEGRLCRLDAWDAAWRRPDHRWPKAEWSRLLVVRGAVLLVCLVPLLLNLLAGGSWWAWLAWGLPAAVLVEAGVRAVLVPRAARSRGYAEREEDLLVRRGIFFHTLTVVPYGRLQYVEVSSTPWSRLFGLVRVQLHTASASTDAVLEGVAHGEAARLREELSRRGRNRLAGL